MIVLGQKYKFQPFELEILRKKFDQIVVVPYRDRSFAEIKTEIEKYQKSKLIVLNTGYPLTNELITYLTTLEVDHGYTFTTIEHFMERHLQKCYIPTDHTDLHFLEDVRPFTTWQYVQKRIIDYSASLVILMLSLPLFFYVTYRIKKESPGSIFFRQSRVGRAGKNFLCTKFRSMHENGHHDPYTRENDPRVYKWGKTMRKARIDEIPQIFNVICGDMHLIGPRAEWDILVHRYEEMIPFYHERHLVRPGITGWAQVNYPYGEDAQDAYQKLMYDLYYIKYWSLWLEIKVILKTIVVVLSKKGL